MVVEGSHDIQFLRRISRMLHQADERIVDLATLEQHQELLFLPLGGGDVAAWAERLAPLGYPEMHLYDRETGAASTARLRAASAINRRSGCRAFVMAKRSLENYLHPLAISEARRIDVTFGDADDVATVVARRIWDEARKPLSWADVPLRARNRLRAKAKRWLNTEAVLRMTRERLAERDPTGEVLRWLAAIANLVVA